MGIGPVPAVRRLLSKLNLTLADIDLIELNEAWLQAVRDPASRDEASEFASGPGYPLRGWRTGNGDGPGKRLRR